MEQGPQPQDIREIRKNCPVHKTVNILGKRWALDIIGELVCQGGPKRYNQLQRNLVFITPKILSQRLRELEKASIIYRKVFAQETPIRVEYGLTDKGKDFKKVVDSLREWGKKWEANDTHQDICDICNDWRQVFENNKRRRR